jgi:hypothetical protein
MWPVTGILFSFPADLAAPNLKNRPRTRTHPRLLRNLALEQTVHYLAFGESASQQSPVAAPSSRTRTISCLAERYTIYERRPNAVPKMLVFLKTDRMAHDELVGRPASHEPTRSTIAVSPTRIEPQSRYYEK